MPNRNRSQDLAIQGLEGAALTAALIRRARDTIRRSRPQLGEVLGRNPNGTFRVRTPQGEVNANSLSSGSMRGVVEVRRPLGASTAYADTFQRF